MKNNLKRARSGLPAFFFREAASENLGICRFLFYGIIFCVYIGADFSQWAEVPKVLWHPIFIFDFFRIPVLPGEILGLLGVVWRVSLLLSCLGLLTRPATVCSFLAGCYLLGMQNSFAKTHHMEAMLLLILCVLCFSRCGDGFSLDSLLGRAWRWWPFCVRAEGPHSRYNWPVRLVWVIFTLVFCAAGASKLRNSGLEWITSGYLSSLLLSKGFAGDRVDPVFEWLPFWLGTRPGVCSFLAGATVFLEFCAPLALINGYFRAVMVSGLFLMVSGFWIVMGIPFPQWLAAFVFWIPWDKADFNINCGKFFELPGMKKGKFVSSRGIG